jgi:hypothetical protein
VTTEDPSITVPVPVYVCPKGHRQIGAAEHHAWRSGIEVAHSGPICSVCYLEWLSRTFPTTPAPEPEGDPP